MRVLGWLGGVVGLFCLLAAGFAYAIMKPTGFDWIAIVAILGLVGVSAWFGVYWSTLRELGDESSFGRMVTAAFAVVLALGIGVVLNIVTHRYDKRWDLTQDQHFSLSQESKDIAAKLDREIEVHAFFVTGSPEASNFEALMDSYGDVTSLLKVTFHDPYADPLLTEQMKVLTDRGTVILKSDDREQRLEDKFGEEAVTNGLVRLTSAESHAVCVVTGHGERDVGDEYGVDGLGFAKIKLEGKNYRVTPLNLLEKPLSPADCKVVVLAGPQTDLAPLERDRLARFVAGGGGLLAMLDPLVAPETAADFARYGLKLASDVVIEGDPNRQTNGGPTVVILDESSYEPSPLTEKLRGVAVMMLARSVDKGADVSGLTTQVLARASDLSWGETKLDDATTPPTADPGVDVVGKVPLAVSVEVTDPAAIRTTTDAPAPAAIPGLAAAPPAPETGPEPKAGGKVVVFGDSDFASNQLITKYTNQDLFLNAVAWMVGESDQLTVRANDAKKGKLEIDQLGLVVTALVAVLGVPGLAVIGGVGTLLRRRRM